MAKTPSLAARIAVFAVLTSLCGLVAWSVFRNTSRQPLSSEKLPAISASAADSKQPPASSTPEPVPPTPPASVPAAQPVPVPSAATPPAVTAKLVAQRQEGAGALAPLGSLDSKSAKLLEVTFSLRGAGIASVKLTQHFTSIERNVNVEMQHERTMPDGKTFTPLSLLGVQIDSAYVSLAEPWAWKEIGPGEFEAIIVEEGSNTPVGRVHRKFELPDASYIIRVNQEFTNIARQPRSVQWYQIGPLELSAGDVTYGGDKRRARFGYLVDASSDPTRQLVLADDSAFLLDRNGVVGGSKPDASTPLDKPLWPTTHATERKYELVWTGATNRYFAAVTIPLLPQSPAGTMLVKNLPNIDSVDRLFAYDADGGAVALRLNGIKRMVEPGKSLDMSQGFFTGPMSAREINKDPVGKNAGLDGLIYFTFGGPCGCCTFAWLTQPLLGLLTFLHTMSGDWAVAIILLVVIVKSLLHPITRWSQIRLQRFGKQMQGMAPKMAKIKEKYANEPKLQQEETAKLWREEGINPAGALGCLPMFLQTPVWMALSATLFFAIELRHEGAFYGIFQMLGSPGNVVWFLGDLAEPDRLWYFPARAFSIPFISGLMGPISSLNIMPLFLGVLFYVQQKYMTPPPTTAQTPEQETQAKMMRWMTVFMFPIMMYNAPSGLTLYFFANSALGILESKWIKRHIEKHDLLNVQKIREAKANKGKGFFGRLQEMATAQQAKRAKQIAGTTGKDPDRYVRKKL